MRFARSLATAEARKDNQSVALTRVEQLYPFAADQIRAALDRYPTLGEVCWVQEEPENMGAWEFIRPLLEQLIDGRWPLRYIGRVRNSSPSEGSSSWHNANQRAIPHDLGLPGFWQVGDTTWPGLGTVACVHGSRLVAEAIEAQLPAAKRERAGANRLAGRAARSDQPEPTLVSS